MRIGFLIVLSFLFSYLSHSNQKTNGKNLNLKDLGLAGRVIPKRVDPPKTTTRGPASVEASQVRVIGSGVCYGPNGEFIPYQHPEYWACMDSEERFKRQGHLSGKALNIGIHWKR